jgi:subtilisin family serine protease
MRSTAARWQVGEALEVLGASPALSTVRIKVPEGTEDRVRERLLDLADVEAVEPNGLMWASDPIRAVASAPRARPPGTTHAPGAARDEPLFTLQAWHYDLAGLLPAWEVTTGSPNVVVAVVDDGIRFDHPDIAANLRSDGYDFVTEQALTPCTAGTFTTSMDGDGPDPDPTMPASLNYDATFDCVAGLNATGGHGLHVAGTIGASAANGVGGVGVSWNVGIRPIRVLGSDGSGAIYDIAQGILYAAGLPANGGSGGTVQAASAAHVINLSLGGPSPSATLRAAVIAASNTGSLLVAAAGNEGTPDPNYPAAYPEVLSVAAVAPSLSPATYSSFGSTVDIAAPGGERAYGDEYGVWSLVWDFQNGGPWYESYQGTSMATPHVSGIAALVLAANPGLTATQLRARLLDHATDLGAPGRDDVYGEGLVNANASVRGGIGAPRDTYVWVTSAQGAVFGPVRAGPGGDYRINALPDGTYFVHAGEDRNGDLLTGYFDRRWGSFGGSTTPATVSILQSSIAAVSFPVARPLESEQNGTLPTADPLPVGGYAYGTITSSSDVDLYQIEVPVSTTMRVETDALVGACGLADPVDTVVRLLDATGSVIAENDDVNTTALRKCSLVQATVPAGTYFVEVTGWNGDVGYYAVRAARTP